MVPNVKNENIERILLNEPPSSFLVDNNPLPIDKILNAYRVRTWPELVRSYHAAAEFPTKLTWLDASWTGLNFSSVAKYFSELEETWKGHGRKINLVSDHQNKLSWTN